MSDCVSDEKKQGSLPAGARKGTRFAGARKGNRLAGYNNFTLVQMEKLKAEGVSGPERKQMVICRWEMLSYEEQEEWGIDAV